MPKRPFEWKPTFTAKSLIQDAFECLEFLRTKKEDQLYIITEYMANGSLDNYLQKNQDMPLNVRYQMMKDTATGMDYLHQLEVIHRDLSSRNLLVDENKRVKVGDFGLSRVLEDNYYTSSNKSMPIKWSPPEALNYQKFSKASDVWSFGVVIWEILENGKVPYPDKSNKEVIQAINDGFRMEKPKNCIDSLFILMMWCWQAKPEERPTFRQIIEEIQLLVVDTIASVEDKSLPTKVSHEFYVDPNGVLEKDDSKIDWTPRNPSKTGGSKLQTTPRNPKAEFNDKENQIFNSIKNAKSLLVVLKKKIKSTDLSDRTEAFNFAKLLKNLLLWRDNAIGFVPGFIKTPVQSTQHTTLQKLVSSSDAAMTDIEKLLDSLEDLTKNKKTNRLPEILTILQNLEKELA